MEIVLILFACQGVLGAFDNLYHHELTERLPWRPSAARELQIHALRQLLYVAIFLTVGWLAWHGLSAWIFAALLVVEIGVTLWDFVIEDKTRELPWTERVTHTLLAINYGVILGVMAPVLADWAALPTGVAFADRGILSWLMTVYAAGVLAWGIRDYLRSRALQADHSTIPSGLAAALPDRLSVLVTGGTGFIGSRLCQVLIAGGHEVTVLTRDKRRACGIKGRITLIDRLGDLDHRATFDAIVNLAGEPLVSGRWTSERKRRLIESRVGTTRGLIRLITLMRRRPKVLVSGSAIGFYGSDDDAEFVETSQPGDGFAHELCRAWEAQALEAERLGVRTCLLRTGLVLGRDGGALAQMLPPFAFGLGGPMGHGRQWVSWIHRDDLVGLILQAIADDSLRGPINGTAPSPVRQRNFARSLGRVLHRPVLLPMPAFVLRLIMGEMAEEILLTGQKVLPEKARSAGYRFAFPCLDAALVDILGHSEKSRRRPSWSSRQDRRQAPASPRGDGPPKHRAI